MKASCWPHSGISSCLAILQESLNGLEMSRESKRTFITAGQSESRQSSDDAKDILGEDSADAALGRIRPMYSESRTRRSHDLLLFGPRKLSQDRLSD